MHIANNVDVFNEQYWENVCNNLYASNSMDTTQLSGNYSWGGVFTTEDFR